MKHQFQFDKKTGTMVPVNAPAAKDVRTNAHQDVSVVQSNEKTEKPKFQKKVPMVTQQNEPAGRFNQVVQMQRVDKLTPVQLVNEAGLPESYLDCISTGILIFRERQDYDICQIVDEKTGKVLAYIGGYGLAFNFNMEELRSMERIEQCLEGLKKLFRHKIMKQNMRSEASDK